MNERKRWFESLAKDSGRLPLGKKGSPDDGRSGWVGMITELRKGAEQDRGLGRSVRRVGQRVCSSIFWGY